MEKTTTQAKAGIATTLVPGDVIAVNLVANGEGGERLSVAQTFNQLGNAVDGKGQEIPSTPGLKLELLQGQAAPEFPMAKYNELIETGQVEAAEDLKAAHEMEVEAFESDGGMTLPDAIGKAALDWADRVHGVKTHDGPHPWISPDQVVVKNVYRNAVDEPGVFIVQLNPVWG